MSIASSVAIGKLDDTRRVNASQFSRGVTRFLTDGLWLTAGESSLLLHLGDDIKREFLLRRSGIPLCTGELHMR